VIPQPDTRATAEVLRLIDEATASITGQQFFDALVRNVAQALGAHCTFITRFSDDLRTAHVRAFWLGDQLLELFSYALHGTPCEVVLPGDVVCIERDVAERFPDHRRELEEIGARSYLAIPLRAMDGQVIGHLAVIDRLERVWQESEIGILRIFAARATAELQREEFEDALRAANEEMRRMKEAAEEASRAKSDFLATMSHELRTPLNGVLGYAQILKRGPALDTNQQRSVDSIERCAEHLLALISDVLDLAKIEAGKLDLHPNPVWLADFLDSVAEMGRMDALRSGLRFIYEIRSPVPACITVDERRLRQILLNLLSNAVKYTDEGAVTFRVDSRRESDGRLSLVFEVEDTGIGIAPGQAERIFDRFERANDLQPTRTQGTGLGLTISRRLARAMGGDISVESGAGAGTGSRFTARVMVDETPADASQAVPAAGTITGYKGPRRRVLVVDDQPDNREVLQHLLTSLGFAVDEAADGPGAIEAATYRKPDIVLMDLVMPGMTGTDTLQNMRQRPGLGSVPVVAVSASAMDRTREQSAVAGFQAFLPKPLRFDRLLEVVGELLGLAWIATPTMAEALSPPSDDGTSEDPQARALLLETLYDLARRGDVRAIESRLAEFERVAPPDDELAARLRNLTQRYDMKGIRALLRSQGEPAA
jgi:signal transduction histidine kinase/DNA-binding NarL/FixJ family response regulator